MFYDFLIFILFYKFYYNTNTGREDKLPRQLDEEAVGAGRVGDVLELVAKLVKFGGGAVKRALNLVLGEDAVVKLVGRAAPEAVEERGVGEALDVLGDVAVVEDDVRLVGLLNVLEGALGLVEEDVDVLVASAAEALDKLSLALFSLLLAASGFVLAGGLVGLLGAAEIGGGDHGSFGVRRSLGVCIDKF